ncbi:hypothetical protein M9Y10_031868 [Tritrichomonas musculus]|uniref:Uncharacterized protein n=1 Tax=Tritrichomonas musculus TaxID=1915356 RepID=A0ABR2GZZ6_9EUKA
MLNEAAVQKENHVFFMRDSPPKLQDPKSIQEKKNIIRNTERESLSPIMRRAMSNPEVYKPYFNTDQSENEKEIETEKISSYVVDENKAIRSDPSVVLFDQLKKKSNSESLQSDNFLAISHKRYFSTSVPINMSNKMPLGKNRQVPLGGKINKTNLQKIYLYGKKVHVGLGFPSKMPIVVNKNSEIIEKSEESFNNLEDFIQKIKSDGNSLDSKTIEGNKKVDKNKSNKINMNLPSNISEKERSAIKDNDIHRVSDEICTTNQKFVEMETCILNEFTDIKTSISKIIEDRKEIQNQHRIWLQNMKKKIYITKEETKRIEISPLNII